MYEASLCYSLPRCSRKLMGERAGCHFVSGDRLVLAEGRWLLWLQCLRAVFCHRCPWCLSADILKQASLCHLNVQIIVRDSKASDGNDYGVGNNRSSLVRADCWLATLGLCGLADEKCLKNSEMKSCMQPARKNGTWKHFTQISGAPVS